MGEKTFFLSFPFLQSQFAQVILQQEKAQIKCGSKSARERILTEALPAGRRGGGRLFRPRTHAGATYFSSLCYLTSIFPVMRNSGPHPTHWLAEGIFPIGVKCALDFK